MPEGGLARSNRSENHLGGNGNDVVERQANNRSLFRTCVEIVI
jgi:hypothetical protein